MPVTTFTVPVTIGGPAVDADAVGSTAINQYRPWVVLGAVSANPYPTEGQVWPSDDTQVPD